MNFRDIFTRLGNSDDNSVKNSILEELKKYLEDAGDANVVNYD